jgi:hypothetical protein
MLHPIGTTVTVASEAWQVIGYDGHARRLLSLDGTREALVSVDSLTEAP